MKTSLIIPLTKLFFFWFIFIIYCFKCFTLWEIFVLPNFNLSFPLFLDGPKVISHSTYLKLNSLNLSNTFPRKACFTMPQPRYLKWVFKTGISQSLRNINSSSVMSLCFPGKQTPANAKDAGLLPGPGRSPGDENGNPLQCSCLGNPMDKAAWQAIVHTVAKSWTQLSN